MRDQAWWQALAADYDAANQLLGWQSSHRALLLAMQVAEHETNNGAAWPGTNNFGAVQLRSLTADELAAFKAGTLKSGDYTPSRDGVLHVDTHPLKGGGAEPYPVWFAAFPSRPAGIAHFLKVLWNCSQGEPDKDGADEESVATQMYCGHYFEGAHHDDRPFQARRALPLSTPEQEDVDDYAGATRLCGKMILAFLPDWAPSPFIPAGPDPAAGQGTLPSAGSAT